MSDDPRLTQLRLALDKTEEIIRLIEGDKLEGAIDKLPAGLQDGVRSAVDSGLRELGVSFAQRTDSFLGMIERNTDVQTSFQDLVDEHG